jgi:glutamyl-tRNA synthetase
LEKNIKKDLFNPAFAMTTQQVRVRFAPSPTGPLHMGGVRTALFNYLFARRHKGVFILRIEDTDQGRYVPGAEEYIIESLKWCGIKIDEGVSADGPHQPYRQSERKDIYREYAEKLVQSGNAYYAFDTPEELEALRKEKEGKGEVFQYDTQTRKPLNNSLAKTAEETKSLLESGVPHVVRFKMPENEELQFHDIIRGDVTVNTSTLDDKVLFKSEGMPTYHLANVVDDYLMQITHVIRGEEWLPSLPLHILLYRSFEWTDSMPKFAHLPLLLKPSGQGKLSKRDGDKLGFPVFPLQWKDPSTGEISSGYREAGYYPEAFVNILALLGWNPGTEQEVFSLQELIDAFSLERVGKSGSRFDPEKARWFNHHYLQQKSNAEIAKEFYPLLKEKGFDIPAENMEKIVSLVKDRVNFVNELWEQTFFFFSSPIKYDQDVIKKRWNADTPDLLKRFIVFFEKANEFSSEYLEEKAKAFIHEQQMNMGQIMNVLRLCLVGESKGPGLFQIAEIIGQEETIHRIRLALSSIHISE